MNKQISIYSPFTAYFSDLCEKLTIAVEICVSNSNASGENKFFLPEALDLVASYFYIFPLWTGILLKHTKDLYPDSLQHINTKVCNNVIEGIFSYRKTSLLQKKIRVHRPGDIINIFWKDLYAKYINNYDNIYKEEYIYNAPIKLNEPTEMWVSKNSSKKR
jgi:hypothetical protein